MRLTFHAWWCGRCSTKNTGKVCTNCTQPRFEKHAQVHTQDRAVVYYNPATGEHRTPPRADAPIPQVYANQGFERMEIMSMIDYEKQTGIIHEASNFNSGNATIQANGHSKTFSNDSPEQTFNFGGVRVTA